MSGISVVIPTYNQATYLPEAVASVLEQTDPPAEVIVVDDGSTDDTHEVLDTFAGRIEVITQANSGVAAARNAGARRAAGDHLAFLDSDDVWLPHKLERQRAVIEGDGSVALVHCGYEEVDAGGRTLRTFRAGLAGDVAEEMLLLRRPVILGGGSGFLLRRSVFERTGGFDERLGTSADWDLCYRVASRHRVAFVPEVCLRYRVHGSNMHRDVGAMRDDMLRAFSKAFSGDVAPRAVVRRRAYARLHVILAGSFLEAGERREATRQLAAALRAHPRSAAADVARALARSAPPHSGAGARSGGQAR